MQLKMDNPAVFSRAKFSSLFLQLRAWHEDGYVMYPWRKEIPGRRDPYQVWIAEVMAQQTRVATVARYYESWMGVFPSLQDVAAASEQQILKAWEGLGYYRRALNLHKAARLIMGQHGGRFPSTKEELLALPGIGRYTAGAILSLCFDQPETAIDANVIRLFSRLLNKCLSQSRKQDVDEIDRILRDSLASSYAVPAGMLAEALMVLGSRICRPQTPRCPDCPLSPACLAFKLGTQSETVRRTPKRVLPVKYSMGLVLVNGTGSNERVLMVQRKDAEFLGGLWGFPALPIPDPEDFKNEEVSRRVKLEWNLEVRDLASGIPLTQEYSHFQRQQWIFRASCQPKLPHAGGWADSRWVPVSEIQLLPMSVIDQRMARAFLDKDTWENFPSDVQ